MALLRLVDLGDRADDLAETFAKGMIQRLQIAGGLINDPEIISMDEPTVGPDPLGAHMLRNIIRKLRAEGKTVLLTTNYFPEAGDLCNRKKNNNPDPSPTGNGSGLYGFGARGGT